ncbi:MAG: hypothetical protein HFI15_16080 [Lachnospiraceae bacterium]|jgi:hypothetical protein|nr:hypothetical protein [Lachnospiraceae bacterium]
MDYERLKRAVEQISLTEEAEKRILDLEDRQREYHVRKKLVKRGLVAACTVFFLLCVLCILPEKIKETPEWGITAYAKGTGAAQWISLKPGERVLLELDPVRNRYMMELDLPENYYYEKEIIILGMDCISPQGKKIFWLVSEEEEAEALPDVMSSSMYIKILNEKREEVDRVILEVTREYDDCYVQIKKEEGDW